MKITMERHNQTVLVLEGIPYSLVRELNPTSNEVCGKCDLREQCISNGKRMDYASLCWPDGLSSGWFFLQDWDILDKPLVCYATGDHSIAKDVSETKTLDV